ncbi:MAG: right-handed parallel beta-helix repeat-containing protein [Armatimonadota bacterium]
MMRYYRILAIVVLVIFVLATSSSAAVYYVDGARPDNSGNGLSWAAAKKTIQAAITAASSDSEVWVKAVTNGYNESITLVEGVSLYGGFVGNETARNQRNWTTNVTIIDGASKDNSVVTANSGITTATVIDGFTIQNGVGVLWTSERSGGGILCNGGSPTIGHNIIRNNTATLGGGIRAVSGTSPVIEYNTIQSNQAIYGAGVMMYNGTCRYNTITLNTNPTTGNSGGGGVLVGSYSDQVTVSDNTITDNETVTAGGGIYTSYSSAVISGNTVSGNSVSMTSGSGGGIHCAAGSPSILNNTVSENHAWSGGGIYASSTSAMISDNEVTGNDSVAGSSGIIAAGGNLSPVVTRNTITNNHVSTSGNGGGGGIGCWTNSATISFNTIEGNSSPTSGGGFDCWNFSGIVNNNTIRNNGAVRGGGICLSESWPLVHDNLLVGNTASDEGGGVMSYTGSANTEAVIVNNTIVGNTCNGGGGIKLYQSSPAITNNIIAFNTTGIVKDASCNPTLSHNDVYNTGVNYNWTPAPTGSNGNISVDPSFVGNGDYHLQSTSQCIDAGYDTAVGSGWLDIDGEPRQVYINGSSSVDIGADEYYYDYTNEPSPTANRGLPSTDLNDSVNRCNIRWGEESTSVSYGDDFTFYSGCTWKIDKIRVWIVPEIPVSPSYYLGNYYSSITLSKYVSGTGLTTLRSGNFSTGTNTTSDGRISISQDAYQSGGNSYNYMSADGTYKQIWKVDFDVSDLNWTLASGATAKFAVSMVPTVDRLCFLHATNSTSGTNTFWKYFGTTATEITTLTGSGWFGKGSDINVQVFAHPQ